jgi:hypothetical protein
MACPLCQQRKAKRACPGTGQDICTVCCGTKRLTEIACPPTCIYLESAERHPAAVVKRQREQDLVALMRGVGRLTEGQLQLFFIIHTFIARFERSQAPGATRLVDADVAEATGALAATFETASRGVLYEHQANTPGAETLRRELKAFLAEVGRGGGGRFEREAAEVLRGIERGAKHQGDAAASGPTDYLSLVGRILQEPRRQASASPLIVP